MEIKVDAAEGRRSLSRKLTEDAHGLSCTSEVYRPQRDVCVHARRGFSEAVSCGHPKTAFQAHASPGLAGAQAACLLGTKVSEPPRLSGFPNRKTQTVLPALRPESRD